MRLGNNTYRNFTTIQGAAQVLSAIRYDLAGFEMVQKGSRNESPFVTVKRQLNLFACWLSKIIRDMDDVIFVIVNSAKCSLGFGTGVESSQTDLTALEILKRRKMMGSAALNILKSAMVAMVSLSTGLAMGQPKLDIRIDDQKVNITVEESLTPAVVSYHPGDTLRYVITASNIGDGLMTDPAIVDPIPEGVTYIPNTAVGENAEVSFSINQGNTYMPWPPYYTVRNSKGILIKRKATADMISHIKWDIVNDLKPAEKSDLEFLVVVDK